MDLNKLDDLPAEKYKLFEEVSAHHSSDQGRSARSALLHSPLDAEVTSQGIGIHHPLFGKVLKEKMDELKIPCELYAGGKRLGGGTPMTTIDFLKEHLGVSK